MLMYLILFSSAVVNTPKPNVFNTLIALLWSWTGSTLDLMLNIENVTAFFYRQIMTAFSPQNLLKKCSLQLLSLKETFVFEFPNPLACLLWRKLQELHLLCSWSLGHQHERCWNKSNCDKFVYSAKRMSSLVSGEGRKEKKEFGRRCRESAYVLAGPVWRAWQERLQGLAAITHRHIRGWEPGSAPGRVSERGEPGSRWGQVTTNGSNNVYKHSLKSLTVSMATAQHHPLEVCKTELGL